MSDQPTSDPRPDRRRQIAGFGAGALALAAALTAFFLVPRGDDDALVVSDSTGLELPTSSTDPATTISTVTSPSTSTPSAVVSVTSDATVVTEAPATTETPATVAPIETTPPASTAPTITTEPPATTTSEPPTTVDTPSTPVAAIDLGRPEVFGYRLFAAVDVDEVRREIGTQLGEPTLDSDWQTMASECTGSTGYRVLWWGELRMTFERYDTDVGIVDFFEAWSVGDPTVLGLAPIGDVPDVDNPARVETTTGLGVGSTRDDVVAVADNTFEDGDSMMTVLLDTQATRFRFGTDDRVTGFAGGAFDCPTPDDENR